MVADTGSIRDTAYAAFSYIGDHKSHAWKFFKTSEYSDGIKKTDNQIVLSYIKNKYEYILENHKTIGQDQEFEKHVKAVQNKLKIKLEELEKDQNGFVAYFSKNKREQLKKQIKKIKHIKQALEGLKGSIGPYSIKDTVDRDLAVIGEFLEDGDFLKSLNLNIEIKDCEGEKCNLSDYALEHMPRAGVMQAAGYASKKASLHKGAVKAYNATGLFG